MLHYENLQLYLRLGLKLKKSKFNQSQWSKPHIEFQHTKKNRSRKKKGKDGKELYKFMNNAAYGKASCVLNKIINNKGPYIYDIQ